MIYEVEKEHSIENCCCCVEDPSPMEKIHNAERLQTQTEKEGKDTKRFRR